MNGKNFRKYNFLIEFQPRFGIMAIELQVPKSPNPDAIRLTKRTIVAFDKVCQVTFEVCVIRYFDFSWKFILLRQKTDNWKIILKNFAFDINTT